MSLDDATAAAEGAAAPWEVPADEAPAAQVRLEGSEAPAPAPAPTPGGGEGGAEAEIRLEDAPEGAPEPAELPELRLADLDFFADDAAAPPAEPAASEPQLPEEAFAFGEPESEAAVGIGVEHAATATRPEDFAREGRLRMEAGDFEGAFERLSLALSREPSDLTVARDLSRVAEKLGRFDSYVQFGEICADAIAAYDPLAAAARFRHFSDVLREKLGNPDRAGVMLEKALALVPEDAEARRELNQIWASRPETAPRALASWLEMARRDPADAVALAAASQVSAALAADPSARGASRAAEQGRIAASIAAFVAPASNLPAPRGRLARRVPEDLRARVAVPGAVGPLARLLRLLSPWLEPLFPADLARRGAGPTDRLDPARAPVLAAAVEGAARALSARPHAVFVTGRAGLDLALENTQPPAVVASARLAELPEPALAFLAARTLDLLDRGWALAGKFAPNDVGILLELACRFAGAAPPKLGLPRERAGAFIAVLESRVPAETRAAAAELGPAASNELASADPRAFTAALRRTANRVALLYTGDPGYALNALALLDRRLEAAGPVDAVQALALPDLRDLALFALSDPFLDLRAAVSSEGP